MPSFDREDTGLSTPEPVPAEDSGYIFREAFTSLLSEGVPASPGSRK